MERRFDVYSLLGILIAIALAILSPNIPKISAIGFIIILVIFIFLVILIILLNLYLSERRKRQEIEDKTIKLGKEIETLYNEISFLKERFKTIEDLSETKAKISIIERRLFKK